MIEVVREVRRLYEQKDIVKNVEERFRTVVVSGFGKDAVTEEVSTGWWITFRHSLAVINIPPRPDGVANKPDVSPGDVATCTWEFNRGQG